MDKYEYKLKLDQMKSLIAENNYKAAEEIADSVNWHKVKNVNALIKAGEIYENVGRYEESRDILLMAYDRSPIGRTIVYRLAEVAIKMGNCAEAKEYYDEFVEIAPHDNLKYVLRYKISVAEGADVKTLIAILEELKEQEYFEEWAFELALLYHKATMSEKCIEACDELILWFGDGPYVERALELKMLYQPLTRQQEEKYRQFRQKKDGVVEITPGEKFESGEIVNETVQIPKVKLSPERFNTQNLQEELQKSMQQIMEATEKEAVDDGMDSIKKLVEDIPYLQIPKEEAVLQETAELPHIETDAEIDDSLKTNFRELLAEDYDGQMSLFVPESGHLEPQVSGQMSIEDVLAEWEKTRRAAEVALQEAEQRKLESAKARALQEAGDIMERLADVIPKLDSGLTPKDLLEEQYLGGTGIEDDKAAAMVANMNQILQQEIDRLATENAQMDEQLAAAEAERMAELVTAASKEPSSASLASMSEESAYAEQEQPTEEGAYIDEDIYDAKTEFSDEEQMESDDGEQVELLAAGVQELLAEEASPEPFTTGWEAELEADIAETEALLAQQASDAQKEESLPQLDIEAALLAEMERNMQKEIAAATAVRQEPEEEILPLEEQILPRSKTPEREILPQIVSPEEDMTTHTIQKLSKEQREIFTYFVPISGMEQQLCQALTGAATRLASGRSAATGNMIIQGGQGSGKTVLATGVVKALQKEIGRPNGRIGKIEASVLNQKDVAKLLAKVEGGCLIIEKAGVISKDTAKQLAALLERDTSGVLVIIEDTKKGIEKALSRDSGFAARFSEKINIPIFTSDELVAFAKSYANELGYSIDDMGILALYNSISNIQKLDEATTLTEVKEIVDSAIARAERGGLKKAFSIIASRRYDEDDYVILHEKDFGF